MTMKKNTSEAAGVWSFRETVPRPMGGRGQGVQGTTSSPSTVGSAFSGELDLRKIADSREVEIAWHTIILTPWGPDSQKHRVGKQGHFYESASFLLENE